MKRCLLASVLAGTVAVAIGVGEVSPASLTAPRVEVFAPSAWRAGRAFEVRAEAAPGRRCKPRKWAWTAPTCEIVVVGKDTARLTCFGGPYAAVAAVPTGRGCKGWVGSASIVLTQPTPLPACPPPSPAAFDEQGHFLGDPDGAIPDEVSEIDPRDVHLYYRPGVQSTGRLNLRVFACRPGLP